ALGRIHHDGGGVGLRSVGGDRPPLDARREAGTAPAAQARRLDLVDQRDGLDLAGHLQTSAAPGLHVLGEVGEGMRRQDPVDQSHASTSIRILPMLALLSMRAWASAMASRRKRESITGRSAPVVNSGSISAAKRWATAIFSSSGRLRSTVPTIMARLPISLPT